MYMYIAELVECSVYSVEWNGFESHQRQLLSFGKVTALGVLCSLALFDFAGFFLPSFCISH